MLRRSPWYLQSPAGSPATIRASRDAAGALTVLQSIYDITWVQSGTAALTLALNAALPTRGKGGLRVAIPGYGCPDLASAVHGAGAMPVVVDTNANSPLMSVPSLEQAIADSKLAAVIAVENFGLAETSALERALEQQPNIIRIDDFAQSVQSPEVLLAGKAPFAILSFGRGKPVSQLGGGALLARRDAASSELLNYLTEFRKRRQTVYNGASVAKRMAYNFLLNPRAYALVSAALSGRLGQTHYKPPQVPLPGSADFSDQALTALSAYWGRTAGCTDSIRSIVDRAAERYPEIYASVAGANTPERLLSRMPLRIKRTEARTALLDALKNVGISATAMYGYSLDRILQEAEVNFESQPLPNATRLAAELITLPVHERLRTDDFSRLESALTRFAESTR